MIYLEELDPGNFFETEKKDLYFKTCDFRNSKPVKYFCVSLENGLGSWFSGDLTVNYLDLYRRDNDGNILPIKQFKDNKEKLF